MSVLGRNGGGAKVMVALLGATAAVWLWNGRITAFLGSGSGGGALILVLALPFAAIVTRPVYLQYGERRAAVPVIGVMHALRTGTFKFFFKSILLWLAVMALLATAALLLYREGSFEGVAAACNWMLVASTVLLVTHLIPSEVRLPLAKPVAIYVAAPDAEAFASFAALVARDLSLKTQSNWTVQPSDTAAALVAEMVMRRTMAGSAQPLQWSPMRLTVSRRRIWSQFTGVRPIPIDFIPIDRGTAVSAIRLSGRSGFAVVVHESDLRRNGERALAEPLRIVDTFAARPGRRQAVKQPVAIVAIADAPAAEELFDPEIASRVPGRYRKIAFFVITAGRTGTFAPEGQLAALRWLLRRTA